MKPRFTSPSRPPEQALGRKYEGDLAALVHCLCRRHRARPGEEFAVRVFPGARRTVQRCWNYSLQVGQSWDYPELCRALRGRGPREALMRKKLPLFGLHFLFLLCFDQATKWLYRPGRFPLYGSRKVIPGFFRPHSYPQQRRIFVLLLACRAASSSSLGLIVASLCRPGARHLLFPEDARGVQRGMKLSLSLILAGALGNQIDRGCGARLCDRFSRPLYPEPALAFF